MSTQVKESVVSPNALHAQQLLPDTGQHLFHWALWGLPGMRDQRTRIRRRQCLPVHLSVGRQWHRIELHERARHHVCRQVRPQMISQLLRIRQRLFGLLLPGYPVRHQSPVTRMILPCHHQHFPYLGYLCQSCLDFAQLNPEAPNLDLEVIPAQILDLTIGPPPAKVPRAVHPRSRLITERIVGEPLRCQFLPVQIATGHTSATNPDLSGHTQRHRLSVLVQNVDPRIGHWRSDRHPLTRRCHPVRCHVVHRRAHRPFGRPVGVDEVRPVPPLLRQLRRACLSHHHQRLQALQPIGLAQCTQRRWRQRHVGDAPLLQQCPQRLTRHQPLLRRQVQACAVAESHHHFPGTGIEAERRKLQYTARLIDVQFRLLQGCQIAHTGMLEHHPLRQTCRARGVDHIRQIR